VIPLRDNIATRRSPVINQLLIVLTIGIYILQVSDPDDKLTLRFALIPARLHNPDRPVVIESQREVHTALGVQQIRTQEQVPPSGIPTWLTPTSSIFLHGSLIHLLSNLWFLWIFGDNVEDRLGRFRYLLFYLGGGTLAGFCHAAIDPGSTLPTIGASGAVAAVMGGYLCFFPHANIFTLVPLVFYLHLMVIPAPVFLGFWFLMQLMQGTFTIGLSQATSVAWWAHIGGFVGGFSFALLCRWFAHPTSGGVLTRPGTERRFSRVASPWD
jgi:membrane associated rhomboid family serine protease